MLACNTATARALDHVRRRASIPVVGVVRPGAVAAAAATPRRNVGVIATAGTVESSAYRRAIDEAAPGISVTQVACPELVPMVEAGIIEGRRAESVVRAYLEPLLAAEPAMDTLLLGCTHYPLLRESIERIVGARRSRSSTRHSPRPWPWRTCSTRSTRELRPGCPPSHRVATTGDVEAFVAIAARLFRSRMPVEAVDLQPMAALPLD